jgi:hypothetical protein
MRPRLGYLALAFPFFALAVGAGCSPKNNVTPTPVQSGATNAPTSAPTSVVSGFPTTAPTGSASATPKASSSPSAKPTLAPTLAPTSAPTALPTGFCSGTTLSALPGVYVTVVELGNFASGFTPTSGNWSADAYTAATPAPTFSPIPTLSPTSSPSAGPTATPVTYDFWSGSFSVPAFTAPSPQPSAPSSVNATSGCFYLVTQVGGTSPNTVGIGGPLFGSDFNTSLVQYGSITAFSLPGLTTGNGPFSGSFTLDAGVNGNVTINSFQTVTASVLRRTLEQRHVRLPSNF